MLVAGGRRRDPKEQRMLHHARASIRPGTGWMEKTGDGWLAELSVRRSRAKLRFLASGKFTRSASRADVEGIIASARLYRDMLLGARRGGIIGGSVALSRTLLWTRGPSVVGRAVRPLSAPESSSFSDRVASESVKLSL